MDYLYLLDSNIISEFSKPFINENVVKQLKRKFRFCAISAITLQELQQGMEMLPEGKRKDRIRNFVKNIKQQFEIIPYEERAAIVYGEIAATAARLGSPRPICDTQIAATALAHNMILVTRNVKDFAPIQQFSLLKVENWFD